MTHQDIANRIAAVTIQCDAELVQFRQQQKERKDWHLAEVRAECARIGHVWGSAGELQRVGFFCVTGLACLICDEQRRVQGGGQ